MYPLNTCDKETLKPGFEEQSSKEKKFSRSFGPLAYFSCDK